MFRNSVRALTSTYFLLWPPTQSSVMATYKCWFLEARTTSFWRLAQSTAEAAACDFDTVSLLIRASPSQRPHCRLNTLLILHDFMSSIPLRDAVGPLQRLLRQEPKTCSSSIDRQKSSRDSRLACAVRPMAKATCCKLFLMV